MLHLKWVQRKKASWGEAVKGDVPIPFALSPGRVRSDPGQDLHCAAPTNTTGSNTDTRMSLSEGWGCPQLPPICKWGRVAQGYLHWSSWGTCTHCSCVLPFPLWKHGVVYSWKVNLRQPFVSELLAGQRKGYLWFKLRWSLGYQRETAEATQTCASPLWTVSKLKTGITSSKPQLTAS